MVPVALALRGVGLRRDTVSLMGWFGPRRLASVVFTLMALERFQEASRPVDTLIAAATWTILLSVLAHGLSAMPLSACTRGGWPQPRSRRSSSPACPSCASAAASCQGQQRRGGHDRAGSSD